VAEVSVSADWRYTVLYDGDCAVCSRLASLWICLDRAGRLEVWPSQTPGVRERFPQISPEALDESVQVVDREGRIWRGAPALARICESLPGAAPVARLLGLRRVEPLAERLYRVFARNRFRFGCSAHCATRTRRRLREASRRSSRPFGP
jgi:predicted DCC family thiol-disulfide oxidoreductase YuxK